MESAGHCRRRSECGAGELTPNAENLTADGRRSTQINYASRWTVSGEKAGRQMAMYSAPS